jgi:hypothetical protein
MENKTLQLLVKKGIEMMYEDFQQLEWLDEYLSEQLTDETDKYIAQKNREFNDGLFKLFKEAIKIDNLRTAVDAYTQAFPGGDTAVLEMKLSKMPVTIEDLEEM